MLNVQYSSFGSLWSLPKLGLGLPKVMSYLSDYTKFIQSNAPDDAFKILFSCMFLISFSCHYIISDCHNTFSYAHVLLPYSIHKSDKLTVVVIAEVDKQKVNTIWACLMTKLETAIETNSMSPHHILSPHPVSYHYQCHISSCNHMLASIQYILKIILILILI